MSRKKTNKESFFTATEADCLNVAVKSTPPTEADKFYGFFNRLPGKIWAAIKCLGLGMVFGVVGAIAVAVCVGLIAAVGMGINESFFPSRRLATKQWVKDQALAPQSWVSDELWRQREEALSLSRALSRRIDLLEGSKKADDPPAEDHTIYWYSTPLTNTIVTNWFITNYASRVIDFNQLPDRHINIK